jgi:hypothetical protein
MAGQTKMFIITSDEDVIRQFSLNKNTHIIDLDDANKFALNETDDKNKINLAFLSQLQQLVRILYFQ